MNVELFYTVGCAKCAAARDGLKALVLETSSGMQWREINVVDELDYSVELGVSTLPSVVIDGKLVFSSLPTPAQLARELQQRLQDTERSEH